jgi:hypothetical protein
MSFYFGVGLNFLICVAAGWFWGFMTSDWWGKKWGIPIGIGVFSLMFYFIFNDYPEYLESLEYSD